MTKLAAIVSALFYLTLSTGIHMHIDTCCDTVENVLMVALANDCCQDDEAEMAACEEQSCGDHHSCPTEEINIQLDTEFIATSSLQVSVTVRDSAIEIPSTLSVETTLIDTPINDTVGPPLPEPIFILHSSLVFYG